MTQSKLIVAKFGGSSLKDHEAMRRSAQVANEHQASLIVVSATYGTTNQLIEICDKAHQGDWESSQKILEEIRARHIEFSKKLESQESTEKEIKELLAQAETLARGAALLKDCNPKTRDGLVSTGEKLSSLLMTEALRQSGARKEVSTFDVQKVMRTNDCFGKAAPQIDKIKALAEQHLHPLKSNNHIFVTQGFIGATEDNLTTTLGRGGSDYSAALLAEAIKADTLEIWTDVAGVATTDPRICPKASPIHEITFQEAAELATFGAKILHPTTLNPVLRAKIPVFVGSSFQPKEKGTWIRPTSDEKPLVRAMAMRGGQSLVTVSTPKMLDTHGFLKRVFEIFEKYEVSVDAITTSEISIGMTIDQSVLQNKKLFSELEEIAEVEVENSLALVSLIGNRINHTAGLGHSIFKALAEGDEEINVRMICLGASRHNFCIVVDEEKAPLAIERLHKKFIEEKAI